jgi:hypothetical protein
MRAMKEARSAIGAARSRTAVLVVASLPLLVNCPVYDRNILEIWPCEYRYTKKEIDQIRSGKLKEVYVTKGDAARVLEKVTEEMNIGYTWGF